VKVGPLGTFAEANSDAVISLAHNVDDVTGEDLRQSRLFHIFADKISPSSEVNGEESSLPSQNIPT